MIRIVLDDAKNWLAHDGLWFQAVEAAHGMEAAIAADRAAWESRLLGAGVRLARRSPFSLFFRDPEGTRVALTHWPEEA